MVEVLGEDSLLRAAWLDPRGSGCGMLVEISAELWEPTVRYRKKTKNILIWLMRKNRGQPCIDQARRE